MRRRVSGLLAGGTLLLAGLLVGGDASLMTPARDVGVSPGGAATTSAEERPAGRGVLGPVPVPALAPKPAGGGAAAEPVPGGARNQPLAPEQIGVEQVVNAVLSGRGAELSTTFRYPGASYVKVHFAGLALAPGDYVTVAAPDGRESYTYRGPSSLAEQLIGTAGGTGRWAKSVTGEAAVVRVHRGSDRTLSGQVLSRAPLATAVRIDRVARGFSQRELAERDASQRRPESICGGGDDKYDTVCYRSKYPTEYARSRPVAKMLIGGTGLCTAWRVGPSNRLLTNNHCIASDSDARASEIWFNYQCATCGGTAVERTTKVEGSRVLATDRTLDYALFTVDNFEAIRDFGYLTLDQRVSAAGEEVYIPQHPRGAPKQIAMSSDDDRGGACQVEAPVYSGYQPRTDVAYRCDTEAGSSGSPVISRRTHRVIALHHFGGCPNSGVRADLLATSLKRFL